MATNSIITPMRGRIPASAISTTRVYPIDLVAADPIPGLANGLSACRQFGEAGFRQIGEPAFDAAEQARAMNAILADLNAILAEGGARG